MDGQIYESVKFRYTLKNTQHKQDGMGYTST